MGIPMSIEPLCDWGKQAQPTMLQRQSEQDDPNSLALQGGGKHGHPHEHRTPM